MAIYILLGILLSYWGVGSFFIVIVILLMNLLALFFLKEQRIIAIITVFICICLGCLMFMNAVQWEHNHIGRIAYYLSGKEVVLSGVVISDPQHRTSGYGEKTVFVLKALKYHQQNISGNLLVNAFGRREISYGDHIQIKGKIHRPYEFNDSGNFSYRRYLENQKIYHVVSVKKTNIITHVTKPRWSLTKASLSIQKKLKKIFYTYLTSKEAGLVSAMILGDRSQIPEHIRLLFERTGTAHILAISGIHISVIVFLFMLIVGILPLPHSIKYAVVILLLMGYVLMTGCRVSVIRATIMVSCLYIGLISERESDSLNALGVAAIIIMIINPMVIFQVGFQLSFLSVLSILVVLPQSDRWLITWTGWGKRLGQSLSVSAAAWLGTLGMVAYYFGIITPVALLANLFIVPLMSMVVMLSFGLLLSSSIPLLAQCFALCLKIVLNLMAASAYIFSHMPAAFFNVHVSWLPVLAYYVVFSLIIVLTYLIRRIC